MCYLICDAINYCASSFAMEKMSVYDQIVIKNMKGENMDIKQFLYEFPSKRWPMNSSNVAETCQSPKVLMWHETQKMRHWNRAKFNKHLHYMTHIAQTRLSNNN